MQAWTHPLLEEEADAKYTPCRPSRPEDASGTCSLTASGNGKQSILAMNCVGHSKCSSHSAAQNPTHDRVRIGVIGWWNATCSSRVGVGPRNNGPPRPVRFQLGDAEEERLWVVRRPVPSQLDPRSRTERLSRRRNTVADRTGIIRALARPARISLGRPVGHTRAVNTSVPTPVASLHLNAPRFDTTAAIGVLAAWESGVPCISTSAH